MLAATASGMAGKRKRAEDGHSKQPIRLTQLPNRKKRVKEDMIFCFFLIFFQIGAERVRNYFM
jgi:hypothetical protein